MIPLYPTSSVFEVDSRMGRTSGRSSVPSAPDLIFNEEWQPRPLEPRDPVTLVYVRTVLGGVLDLTDGGTLARLGVTAAALAAEWRPGMEAYAAGTGPMPLT